MYNFSRENPADLRLLNTRIPVGTNILVLLLNLTWSFEIVYVQMKKKIIKKMGLPIFQEMKELKKDKEGSKKKKKTTKTFLQTPQSWNGKIWKKNLES